MEIETGSRWNHHLEQFPPEHRDVYFSEEYVRLYETEEDVVESFFCREGEKVLLFPYLRRRIALAGADCYDLETAYGYGGPIANTTDGRFIPRALAAMEEHFRESRVIAGLVRFHPLIGNHRLFADSPSVSFDRTTVAIDLTQDREDIWKEQVHPKQRNSIRKAQKSGLSFQADRDLRYMDVFAEIYRKTMGRLGSDSFYLFSPKYFQETKKLGDKVFLGLILASGEIVACALFMECGVYGHYHLAGSLEEFKQHNPSSLLVFETALYLKDRGIRLFHLGGGTDRSEQNTLFQFKERFSKLRYPFYVGKFVYERKVYDEVCRAWESAFPEKRERYGAYVLKYRF
jgi:serine/alanine adding enzyme